MMILSTTRIRRLSSSAVVGAVLSLLCLQSKIRPANAFATIAFTTALNKKADNTAASLILYASSDDEKSEDEPGASSINVLGTKMECCCADVANTGIGTGFYRNGYCSTGTDDVGRHTVCIKATEAFLEFSKSVGNDLSTPVPQYMFPGLTEGDIWCLCAQRWWQAFEAAPELAPKLYLKATHEKTLDYVPYDILRMYALDGEEADKERQSLDEKRAQLEKLLENESAQE